jgi:hypothetical protein
MHSFIPTGLRFSMFMNPNFPRFFFSPQIALVLLGAFAFNAQLPADQIPNPAITAFARPFSAAYAAANLFDSGTAEYATAGQGAVSAPFTRNENDGTWVEFDFGSTVTLDRFVMAARQNAVDVIGESRLIVSDDPLFDASDTIFTFNPSGSNGAGLIHNLGPVSGRYVRWEVTSRTGTGLNIGAKQMWFLNTPAGHVVLPSPAVIHSAPAFNASYAAPQAANGNAGYDGGNEYASAGQGVLMFVDFDFGASIDISGFDFWNRVVDRVTAFELVFAESPDFSSPITTLPFTASLDGNAVNSATFAPVTARYVRLRATEVTGGNNTGVREIQFFTPAGQPPFITRAPEGGTRLIGDSFTFSVLAGGDAPLQYQWWQEEMIENATNATLTVTNLQLSQGGSYSVVVSNDFGYVTSEPVTLTVIDPPADITSDLKAWFRMDETIFLTAEDSSGNENHGTLEGFFDDDSQWVAGRIDGGLRFSTSGPGTNEVVLIPDAAGELDFSASPEFTLAAWVRGTPAQEDGAGIIAKGTGAGGEQYALDVYAGTFRLVVRDALGGARVLSGSVAPNNTWQHVVAVYSRTLNRMRIYVNNAEVGAAIPFTTGLLASTHEVSLGSRQLGATDYNLNFNGVMDDVRIYARALTPADVAELYQVASPLPPAIVRQPQPVFSEVGGSVSLSFDVDGTVPFSYQWLKAGAPISGATNAVLTVTNAQKSDEADYRVAVTNSFGDTLSSAARLTVISFLDLSAAPVEASSIFNASFPPAGAFDRLRVSTGPNTARWASAASGPPHWISVDLGGDLVIRRVAVDWEHAYGRDFTIRVRTSDEGPANNPDEWQTIAGVSGYTQAVQGVDGVDALADFLTGQILMPGNTSGAAAATIQVGGVTGRYLMLHVTAVGGGFGHTSVWELQVDAIASLRIDSLSLDANGATLRFTGTAGLTYEVQRAALVTGPWTTVASLPAEASGPTEHTDLLPLEASAFYRVVLP